MATGTPVIAVAERGTKEVLQDGLGIKIADGTISDFSPKIVEVTKQPDLPNSLSSPRHSLPRNGIQAGSPPEWANATLVLATLELLCGRNDIERLLILGL